MTEGRINPKDILLVDVSHLGRNTGNDKLDNFKEIHFKVNVYNEERGILYGTFKLDDNRYIKGHISEDRVLSIDNSFRWKNL